MMSTMQWPVERAFRAMGCTAHIVVHGGDHHLADAAVARVLQLESWWSRFREDSDITRANRSSGVAVEVHPDTLAVVSRALDAWRQTDGRFDITVLPALLEAGYTHSTVDRLPAPSLPAALLPTSRLGMSTWVQVDYERSTLTVPAGSAIDLGGIGKGFAADIVAEELVELGATGALVNLGGDLRVVGVPSDDTSWYLGIENPGVLSPPDAGGAEPPAHVAVLRLQEGGMATSGTTVRTWTGPDGSRRHHLIDPRTGHPSEQALLTATVLAADAATAESFATAAMMLPAPEAVAMLDGLGLAGLIVDRDHAVHRTATMKAFET